MPTGLLSHLRRARDHLDREYRAAIDLDQVAAVAGVSRDHFVRAFAVTYGETPIRYLTRRRIERARHRLRSAIPTVTETCMAVGFVSLGSISPGSPDVSGATPGLPRVHLPHHDRTRCGHRPRRHGHRPGRRPRTAGVRESGGLTGTTGSSPPAWGSWPTPTGHDRSGPPPRHTKPPSTSSPPVPQSRPERTPRLTRHEPAFRFRLRRPAPSGRADCAFGRLPGSGSGPVGGRRLAGRTAP